MGNMQYQITSDNIEVTESMKALAQEKFEKVEARLTEKENAEAMTRIVLNTSGGEDQFRVKIELSYRGKQYFASERDYSMETALIKAIAEVERMRRKDDIGFQEDWNEQREFKHSLAEEDVEAAVAGAPEEDEEAVDEDADLE